MISSMRIESQPSIRWVRILARIGLAAIVVGGVCFWKISNDNRHQVLLSRIPFGTDVGSISRLVEAHDFWGGEVVEWISPDSLEHSPQLERTISTRYGTFCVRNLGNSVSWNPSMAARRHFSGEVTLYLNRSFSDSVCLALTFIDGKLVEKDWGYIPG